MFQTMTRAEFNARSGKAAPVQSAPTMTRAQFNARSASAPKTSVPTMTRAEFNAKSQPKSQGVFNWTMNKLVKPVSAASNIMEDAGKTIGYGIAHMIDPHKAGSWEDAVKKADIHPLDHLGGVINGDNKRTYSDIINENKDLQQDPFLKYGSKVVGYGGDMILDPLNKVKVAALTAKGLAAEKTGKLALSAAEQAKNGERALLQIGKYNVLPSVGNRVLAATTKANDLARGTEIGKKVFNAGAALNGKIRPAGVSRDEFKILTDAKTAARDTIGNTTSKAIDFARSLRETLNNRKATQFEESQLLHAIEKGDEKLAPVAFQDLWKKGVDFKAENEEAWKALGGDTLEGYGMAHVATKDVAEAARKKAFKGQGGFKLSSTNTPQDITRQWVRADGKIVNMADEGIKYGTIEAKKYNIDNVLDSAIAELRNEKKPILGAIKEKTITKNTNKYDLNSILESVSKELSNPGKKPILGAIKEKTIVNRGRKYDLNSILESVNKELNSSKKPILGTPKRFTPEEILRSAIGDLNNDKITPLNRRDLAYQAFQGRKADIKPKDIVSLEKEIKPYQFSTNREAALKPKEIQTVEKTITPYQFPISKEAPLNKDILENVYHKGQTPVKVEQASAQEINNALAQQGKASIFQEDLPLAAARMAISTGKKQAATDFLKATEGLKSEEAKALANEVHDKMVNPESLRKAVQMFDSVQNIWKAQALVAPSYHIRNMAGNLWNNFLADVKAPAYAMAGNLQKNIAKGTLSEAEKTLVKEMEQHGIIGTGQYGGDIAKNISSEMGHKMSINTLNPASKDFAIYRPFQQNFALYGGNKAVGSVIEDNAKIAHYLSKRAEGYGAKQASESVKKYLFDYGDLTDTEKGLLKRVMPFYTWTSKNLPLQIQQFIEKPGKFSKIATARKDVERGVAQTNEKYMSDYMQGNAPIRVKTDEKGNTMYFLAGAWLPAASALTYLSDPVSNTLGMVTPALKLPYENITNKGTFFKNTLGQYEDIQKYPGQKTSYLGMDLSPQTVNNLRSLRLLNELNNLNPGGIFGTKNSPSIFKGILDNASNVRGGQNTPETSQADRVANSFVGKLQSYNPEESKVYYDRDTQTKVTEFNTAINRAINNNQTDLAGSLIKQMEQFVQERDGEPNKALQMYNLLGDKYFKDQAANKLAEKNRTQVRDEMKKQIRQGLDSNNKDLIKSAMQKDPTYAQQALKDAITERMQDQETNQQKKAQYEYGQIKTKYKLNPFYTH